MKKRVMKKNNEEKQKKGRKIGRERNMDDKRDGMQVKSENKAA